MAIIADSVIIKDPAGDTLDITAAGALKTDSSATTQPVSDGGGSITVDGPLTDAQLRATAVPVSGTVAVTGSATAANQTTIIGHIDGVEGILTTIDADTGNISTKIDTIAGAVSGSEMQVDVLVLPAITGTVTANAGTNLNTSALALEAGNLASIKAKTDNIPAQGQALAAASLPVVLTAAQVTTLTPPAAIAGFALETTLGSVKTAVETIDNAISGNEMQVDVLTMPVVAVTQSGTWDEVGINDSGNSITVDNPQLSVVGGGAEATALRVTIANDSTGVLSVDDNGSSLTIDGTVAATQSGTWNVTNVSGTVSLPTGASTSANQTTIIGHLDGVEGLLTTIDADTGNISTKIDTIAGAVSGTEVQVDVLTMPAITGSVTANAGTNLNTSALALEATLQSVKTAVETLDNAVAGSEFQVDVLTMPSVTGTVTANAGTDLNTSALALEAGNLATLVAKDFATQTTLAAFYAALLLAQGADATSTAGPMVQGLVNDTPQSYTSGYVQPISLTSEGRLRVSSVNSDLDKVWNHIFDDPYFKEDDPYTSNNNYF